MAGDFIDGIVAKRGGSAVAPTDKAPGYADAKRSALDDLARILRVMKADRGAFDAAMVDLIDACMDDEDKESPDEEAAEPDDGGDSGDTEEG